MALGVTFAVAGKSGMDPGAPGDDVFHILSSSLTTL